MVRDYLIGCDDLCDLVVGLLTCRSFAPVFEFEGVVGEELVV